MSQLVLSGLAVAAAAGMYLLLGVLWWVRDRADRAAAAHLDAVEIDPYHAVATAGSGHDADRAAAAELLLAGRIQVDQEGRLSITDEGCDPADETPPHPVPAALLTTLRRRAAPVALHHVYWDTAHHRLRDAFLHAEDAKVPRWSARSKDALDTTAILTAVLLGLWFPFQLVFLRSDSTASGVGNVILSVFLCFLIGLMFAVPLGWAALWWWPGRYATSPAGTCRPIRPNRLSTPYAPNGCIRAPGIRGGCGRRRRRGWTAGEVSDAVSGKWGSGARVMSGETGWIVAGWLMGFAGFNAALGTAWWMRTRAERRFLRGARRSDVDPIQAGWWLGASWTGAAAQRATYAAQVAVRLLILAGHAEVDETGRITLAEGRRGAPADPALAALVACLDSGEGVTVHELLTEPRFTPFRTALEQRRAPLRSCFGAYRVPALFAALVVAFGMSVNAMLLRNGVPGLADQDPGWWILLWMAPWAALSLLAAAWPPEASRPWPRFTRRCRAAVSRALADENPETDSRVCKGAQSPPRQASAAEAARRRPSDGPGGRGEHEDLVDHTGDTAHVDVDHGGGDGGGFGGGD